MKGIRIIAVMALLNAVLSKAGDYAGTNNMPEQIHNLMESEGYAFDKNNNGLQMQNTNSLGYFHLIKRQHYIPFNLPAKKVEWSLWTNSKFKRVGRMDDQINLLSPFAALAQYEYDISYSWVF